MCVRTLIYLYLYLYLERESEGKRERERDGDGDRDLESLRGLVRFTGYITLDTGPLLPKSSVRTIEMCILGMINLPMHVLYSVPKR